MDILNTQKFWHQMMLHYPIETVFFADYTNFSILDAKRGFSKWYNQPSIVDEKEQIFLSRKFISVVFKGYVKKQPVLIVPIFILGNMSINEISEVLKIILEGLEENFSMQILLKIVNVGKTDNHGYPTKVGEEIRFSIEGFSHEPKCTTSFITRWQLHDIEDGILGCEGSFSYIFAYYLSAQNNPDYNINDELAKIHCKSLNELSLSIEDRKTFVDFINQINDIFNISKSLSINKKELVKTFRCYYQFFDENLVKKTYLLKEGLNDFSNNLDVVIKLASLFPEGKIYFIPKDFDYIANPALIPWFKFKSNQYQVNYATVFDFKNNEIKPSMDKFE